MEFFSIIILFASEIHSLITFLIPNNFFFNFIYLTSLPKKKKSVTTEFENYLAYSPNILFKQYFSQTQHALEAHYSQTWFGFNIFHLNFKTLESTRGEFIGF